MPHTQIDVDVIAANPWIRTIIHQETVTSTNTFASQFVAADSRDLPLLVLADEQTAGRGRGENQWWSGDGSIALSLAVSRSELTLVPQTIYSLAVAVAVRETLLSYLEPGRIALKWPNDVVLDGQKVAGILLETAAPAASVLVVGIGLNANNDFLAAPPDIRKRATSIKNALGRSVDLSQLICGLVARLEAVFTNRITAAELLAAYRRADFLAGKCIRVHRERESVTGEGMGIDKNGSLLLATAAGEVSLASGTVEIISN
jgi:BirA family transcriptional regulator, biotin operon repressor / biotin---[acetyl-CoA-carboxylase] ligase